MKKIKRASIAGLSVFLLASCGQTTSGSTSSIAPSENGGQTHTFALNYVDTDPIEGALVTVKNADDETVAQGNTNEEGVFSFDAPAYEYTLNVTNMPRGYYFDNDLKFEEGEVNLTATATSKVLDEEMDEGTKYALNDVMYDFSWTDSDNIVHSLRKTLEEKELVIINFWFTTCSNCVNEYPYMIDAYAKYKDNIEIFGLTYESNAQSKVAKANYGCTWPMGYDEGGMIGAFNINGYPTSVFVDRYGRVDYVESGSMLGEVTWSRAIEKYLGDEYVPEKWVDERVVPNVDMPPSSELEAAACAPGFSTTFRNEEDEKDAKWNWPFIVSEDGNSIQPSNQYIDNSYSIVYFDVRLNEDECFAFDYLCSTEEFADVFYVLVNRELVLSMSGIEEDFKTSYCFVPQESGTFEFAFCYFKDGGDYLGEDAVYINNMRIVSVSDIDEPTYILRSCATGSFSQFTNKYSNYINPVYNEEDGYYHVDSVNGPIVMANFLSSTKLSEYSIYDFAVNGAFTNVGGVDYTSAISEFAQDANATSVGYLPVTEEVKGVLEACVESLVEKYFDNKWLEVCVYFDAYGTEGEQMEDPSIGITFEKAKEAKVGDQNFAVFDHVIMPKGIKFYFVAPEAGLYQINSIGTKETESWVFNADRQMIYSSDQTSLREVIASTNPNLNFKEWVYLEEGEMIYILVAFYDIYEFSTLQFEINNVGEGIDVFAACSPGYFTTNLDSQGNMTDIIRLGINVKIGDDGYYHELRKDGSLGSIVYLDVTELTQLFSYSIQKMAKSKDPNTGYGFFDCTVDEYGEAVKGGKDYTDAINDYIKNYTIIDDGDTFGTIPMDKGLAEIMQAFMDKYSVSGIKESWLKLCYYFQHFGK